MPLTTISTVDYHTGGEPFRIVADPPVPVPGASVADRRARAIVDPDVQHLRAVLYSEPRGAPYGASGTDHTSGQRNRPRLG